jgi:site-specific recombinase XerD
MQQAAAMARKKQYKTRKLLDNKRMIDVEINKFISTSTLGERTAQTYRFYITEFAYYLIEQEIKLDQATALDVRTWLKTRANWKPATQYYAISSVRAFFRWKYGTGHPVLETRMKRVDSGPQRTLDQDELGKVLSSIDTSTAKGIRDLAIVTLMLDTGLRSTEVCSILLKNIDLKKMRINVITKGNRWGEAVYFEYTAKCLAGWLAVRPYWAAPDNEFLFSSVGGKTPGEKMTRYGIRMMLENLGEKAGIEHFSPHAMRRSFATLAIENGAPTRLVQAAGRWKDIRMVELYTRKLKSEKIRPFSVVNGLMGLTEPE